MKKFVLRIAATNLGWGRFTELTQMPRMSSRVAMNAIVRPSGDQRGLLAFQPAGKKGRDGVRPPSQLRRASGWRLVGLAEKLSPDRASQSVLTDCSPSVVETV